MELSEKLQDLLRDVAKDPEFQFDYKLGDDVDSNIEFIKDNADVLRLVLIGIKLDYEHDIAMEEADGEDIGYLEPILNEVKLLLNDL